ncbi:hypothetical protein dsat_1778 [Alkalidesulfovibrio alkalitolerans DSM 16529]|uniref:Uncharacterized protein n=1 Tax=Alkalidesulfovibrio alkalitolerans DSM 16529 TaxID=1121439 RepID=S7TI10_9BACT|nr:hypothetical protein [Alkalidesulfovibrio alkalitolerans]EPR36250.1 hypothetical protein dsat_1778 [Alkalidesulfovibrio alkalitolerans DSM 16529]
MTADIAICNMALTALGHETIAAPHERTKAAGLCRLHYHGARRELLEAHHWAFATGAADLALVHGVAETATARALGYAFAFMRPADCLKARRLTDDAPFEPAGRLILCNVDKARLIYTRDLTESAVFPAAFTRALSFLLASLLAVPLMQSQKLERSMLEKYLSLVEAARETDADQGAPAGEPSVAWIEARR